MHVMTKYLDTRAAAINALQDFALMEQAAELPVSAIEAELRGDLTSPSTSRADGMPRSNDPTAGVSRVCATLDKIDMLHERKREAREYLDWFLPAWALLSVIGLFKSVIGILTGKIGALITMQIMTY